MMSTVPLCDLALQDAPMQAEIQAAVEAVLQSRRFILGPDVAAFEAEFAAWHKVSHAIGVSSGTDALLMSLMALGIGPGHEVVTTPLCFVAGVEAILRVGARPVFVDIDPVTFNLDAAGVEGALTEATRAVLAVHLYGHCADMTALRGLTEARGLFLIEDTAQAVGAMWNGQRAGTMGQLGCFSFFPTKNLGGAGDGGMVLTSDAALADRLRGLRSHGVMPAPRERSEPWECASLLAPCDAGATSVTRKAVASYRTPRPGQAVASYRTPRPGQAVASYRTPKPGQAVASYRTPKPVWESTSEACAMLLPPNTITHLGGNFRLDTLQAAILRVKLRHLDTALEQRRQVAHAYLRELAPQAAAGLLGLPSESPSATHAWNLFTIRIPDHRRDLVRTRLANRGIEARVYYPRPLHLEPLTAALGYSPGDFPHAEAVCKEVLSLPLHAGMPSSRIDAVITALQGALR